MSNTEQNYHDNNPDAAAQLAGTKALEQRQESRCYRKKL
jgi:hypothetical protein